ncbi:glycosyltransferase family 4 protein [Acetobacteraceae bacterium KSS8]|uniref:Glycosyltransferase family 4 protein n=1 Tax=Endosaccharibacter trunci TaxID=2812733 RepID=A0ABT1W4F6_9PROT|nr:glycosyltransferase family 4 protein [Acetobacteraceae bacterium KSS8]
MSTEAPRLHPLHRAWQMLPARSRRLWLARGSAWLAPKPARVPPPGASGVVVGGEIDRASGLGESARLMAAALHALGVPGGAIEAGPGVRAGRALSDWPDRSALVLHVNAPVLPAALLGLGRRALRGRRVIGFWAWELPTVPEHWRPALPLVHEVWAPSRFTADALRTLGLDHVRVVPHPVAVSPPAPSALDRQAFGLDPEALVVLCAFSLASSFERKNPLASIEAFRAAFGDRPDRVLVLKAGHGEHYPADLARLRDAVGEARNIRLETRTLPAADMHALTRCSDMVLSLHRSEGFGLVPAEAMLLGKPVLATDWSATTEFLDESCGVPIGYRLVPARDPRGVFEAPGAVWADADIGAAAQALRALADAPERRTAIGQAARHAAQVRLGTAGLEAALAAIGVPVPGLAT